MSETPLLRDLTPSERRLLDSAWDEYLEEARKAIEISDSVHATNKEMAEAFQLVRRAWDGYTNWLEKNHIVATLAGYRVRQVQGLHTRYRVQCQRIGVQFSPTYRKTEAAAFKYARAQLALPENDTFKPTAVEICVSHRLPMRGCSPCWEPVAVLKEGG